MIYLSPLQNTLPLWGDFDEADRQYAKVRNNYRDFCRTREMGIYGILATDDEEKKLEKKADSWLKRMR